MPERASGLRLTAFLILWYITNYQNYQIIILDKLVKSLLRAILAAFGNRFMKY